MKGSKGTTSFMFLLLFFVTIFFSPLPALADTSLYIDPAISSPTAGSLFDVFVRISNVTDLYAFQFDIIFDPAILSFTSVTEGSFLPSGGSTFFIPGTIDTINNPGIISFTADALIGALPGVTGSGTLADISFLALGSGTSSIDLSNVLLFDSGINPIVDASNQNGSVTVVSGVSVPEPATLFLISMGMVALGIVRKKGSEII